MQVGNYLEKYHPIIYKTFLNSLKNNKLSHAYLISGDQGTPLLEIAKYLAKSLLCDDPSPLACNNCFTCLRVDDDNYPDLIIYDGSKSTIKKDQTSLIESRFDKKALETKGIMIYVLHLVENMTVEAINSILKFLEEPENEVFAFLTTNNTNNVLPTIVSRCQNFVIKQVDKKHVIEECVQRNINKEDAELLSYFYNNEELILEVLKKEEESSVYFQTKQLWLDFLSSLLKEDPKETIYFAQKTLVNKIKTKEQVRYFIDMLTAGYENIIALQNGQNIVLESYVDILNQLKDKLVTANESLLEILKARNLINTNVNVALLLDHIVLKITKGDK